MDPAVQKHRYFFVAFHFFAADMGCIATGSRAQSGCFFSYLMSVVMLSVALGLAGLLLWTIHRYRWYDPNSAPEEWELPEALLLQDQ